MSGLRCNRIFERIRCPCRWRIGFVPPFPLALGGELTPRFLRRVVGGVASDRMACLMGYSSLALPCRHFFYFHDRLGLPLDVPPVFCRLAGADVDRSNRSGATPCRFAGTSAYRACCAGWFCRHSMNWRNRASRCCWLRFAAPDVVFKNASNSALEGLSALWAEACALRRLSMSSATLHRVQPGTVAAKLTSRHFGWRGGCWNLSHFVKRACDEPFHAPVAVAVFRPVEHREHGRHRDACRPGHRPQPDLDIPYGQLADRVVVRERLRERDR